MWTQQGSFQGDQGTPDICHQHRRGTAPLVLNHLTIPHLYIHGTPNKCCCNAVPPSPTVGQHCSSIGSAPRVSCAYPLISLDQLKCCGQSCICDLPPCDGTQVQDQLGDPTPRDTTLSLCRPSVGTAGHH